MDNEKNYMVVIQGRPAGPFTMEELKGLKIKSDTFIKVRGMDDYKEAHAIPELRALFNLKPIITAPQYFGSFDLRLFASVVDHLLISMIYVFCILISFAFIKDTATRIYVALFFSPLIIIGKFIYSVIAESSKEQATIGKRLVKIRVTDLDGKRISFSVAFLRNLSKLASTLPFFIGYLYSFLNKKQQCLHDVICDTLVVKDRLL